MLSRDRQSAWKRIQSNDSKDDPRTQKKNGGTDWEETRNVEQRARSFKELTEMNNTITEMKNTLDGINSRINEAEE